MSDLSDKPVLLTGATGFIGRNLYPKLDENGYDVRCCTRNPERAREQYPDRKWIELDVHDPDSVKRAMDECGAVYYLIHEMSGGEGYKERERSSAETFRMKAEEVGVDRIIYLGGVAPKGEPSDHLKSRIETGEILRNGSIPAIELRASMIIGSGSTSWQIVEDLVRRLPVMILPKWAQSRTQPVYIDDVTEALTGALELNSVEGEWYDIPGPNTLSVEEIFRRSANVINSGFLGVNVPVLSPKLSSYWLLFITRADFYIAQELVQGLKQDLLAESDLYWEMIDHTDRIDFDEAVRRTLNET